MIIYPTGGLYYVHYDPDNCTRFSLYWIGLLKHIDTLNRDWWDCIVNSSKY